MNTTGELLQKARTDQGLSFEDVEKKTRIRKKYLAAVEKNDWSIFPSKTYILGVLHSYGRFLKLDEEKITAFFRREYEKTEEMRFKERVSKEHLTPRTKKIARLFVAILVLTFGIYFAYQLQLYFSPPFVEIISPKKTSFERKPKIELVGKTEKEAIVMVNGERVFQDKNNIFKVMIPLSSAKNEVVIEVTGANGKKRVLKQTFEKKN